jgi:hypothetical protein
MPCFALNTLICANSLELETSFLLRFLLYIYSIYLNFFALYNTEAGWKKSPFEIHTDDDEKIMYSSFPFTVPARGPIGTPPMSATQK